MPKGQRKHPQTQTKKGAQTLFNKLAVAWRCSAREAERRCKTMVLMMARQALEQKEVRLCGLVTFYLQLPEPKRRSGGVVPGAELIHPLPQLKMRTQPWMRKWLAKQLTSTPTPGEPLSPSSTSALVATDLSSLTSRRRGRTRSATPSSPPRTTH